MTEISVRGTHLIHDFTADCPCLFNEIPLPVNARLQEELPENGWQFSVLSTHPRRKNPSLLVYSSC